MINSISAYSQTGAAQTQAPDNELGQADFLQLLTAELQNQDPDSPMDSQAMLDQFATLSNVQAITGLNSMMGDYLAKQDSKATFDAASMIGKEVSVVSGQYANVNGALAGAVEPPVGVGEVLVQVKDKLGQVVSEQKIDTSSSDVTFAFSFDDVGQGDLTVEASYIEGGVTQHVDVVQSSTVSSVRLENGEMLFKLDSGKYALLGDIRTISA